MEFNNSVDIWRALTLQTSPISGLCLRPMNQDSHPFLNSPTLFLFLGYFFFGNFSTLFLILIFKDFFHFYSQAIDLSVT